MGRPPTVYPSKMDEPWEGMGVNFITPDILIRGISDDVAWELSKGSGMEGEDLYGTTFLVKIEGEWSSEHSHSTIHFGYRDALHHIVQVVNEVNGTDYGKEVVPYAEEGTLEVPQVTGE